MPLTADCFFEKGRAKAGHIYVLELGHRAKLLMQSRIEFAAKVLTSETHAAFLSGESATRIPSVSTWIWYCRGSGIPEFFHSKTDGGLMPIFRAAFA